MFEATVMAIGLVRSLRSEARGREVPDPLVWEIERRLNELVRSERFGEAEDLVRKLQLPRKDEEVALRQIAEIRDRPAQIREWNNRINEFVRSGDFDAAIRFVRTLDLPQKDRDDAARRIQEVARTRRETLARLKEWNDRLNALLRQGDFEAAIRFVRSLDLPLKQKDGIVDRIEEMREAETQRQKSAKAAQEWCAEFDARLKRGDVDAAARFVGSSDLPLAEKSRLVSQIYEDERRQRQQQNQTEAWYNELVYLLGAHKEKEARKYARSLPIDKIAQEALYQRAQAAVGWPPWQLISRNSTVLAARDCNGLFGKACTSEHDAALSASAARCSTAGGRRSGLARVFDCHPYPSSSHRRRVVYQVLSGHISSSIPCTRCAFGCRYRVVVLMLA
jgi:CHASE3 domain sensor protein